MPVTLQLVDKQAWDSDPQIRHDLQRIYADAPAERLRQPVDAFIDEQLAAGHFFGCARFNGRLVGAAVVSTDASAWWLAQLCVRQATRRRGVGSRLLLLIGEAAHVADCELRALSSQLTVADQLLLIRLGYRLNASGNYFALILPSQGDAAE